MPEQKLSSNRLIGELFQTVNIAGDSGLKRLLDVADRRTRRLQSALERLQSQLGPEHPHVGRLNVKANGAGALKAELKTLADRTSVKSSEWAVCGRVLNVQGAPATEVTVRVADKRQKYAELLGSTRTRADGSFVLVYSSDMLEALLEEKVAPDLYVSVTGAKGVTLFSASEPIHCGLGKLEHYAIRLGEKPPMTKSRQAIVRKPVRKKTTTRSPKSQAVRKTKE